MTKNTLFTIFICSILLSSSFSANFSSLNFSPFAFAQEQEAESSTEPPAESSTEPPAESSTEPPADTSTTEPPADTSTTDPPADTSTTDPPADTSTTDPPADTQPVIIEEDHSTDEVFEKEITISPNVSLDTEVVVSTEIPENLVEQGVEFQLYQVDGTTKTDVTSDDAVAAELVDTDGDNVADVLQWQASQTSEQTFVIQGIIVTTAAEHLDSSRAFIENVYDKTNAQDGIWTDPIPVDDYIRVTFEKALSSSNDITIYAKSSADASIEVYEKDGTEPVANFGTISGENTYKILLTNLSTSQDTFDLKIVGAPIQFDLIIDPPPPNPSIGLEQCHNDDPSNGFFDCEDPSGSALTWGNGAANANNAELFEGNSQNYRIILKDMEVGTPQTITIGQQFTKGGKMAYDFPT